MKIKKHLAALLLLILPLLCVNAQWVNPVSFTIEKKKTGENQIILTIKGTIEPGWHVYSTDNSGGPTPATFNIDQAEGIVPVGKLQPVGKSLRKFEEIFGMEVSYFENQCAFRQRFTITKKEYHLKGYLEYGACDDQNCIPPTPFDITIKGTDGLTIPSTAQNNDTLAATGKNINTPTETHTVANTIATEDPLWSDATKQINGPTMNQTADAQGGTTLWWLFVMGLTGGLLALFTPCVWPIIPMTVSLFLKRSEKRSRGIRDALIYGLGI
ncbi:MAG: protein-disulfide reductase DsbD domain-containing protein, partial [Bacteroidaceae bacterium]